MIAETWQDPVERTTVFAYMGEMVNIRQEMREKTSLQYAREEWEAIKRLKSQLCDCPEHR